MRRVFMTFRSLSTFSFHSKTFSSLYSYLLHLFIFEIGRKVAAVDYFEDSDGPGKSPLILREWRRVILVQLRDSMD